MSPVIAPPSHLRPASKANQILKAAAMGNFATALKQLKEQALFRFVERSRSTQVAEESKGEAVALLAAVDVDLAQLRSKLNEAGVLPNVWIPKKRFNRAN